HLSDFPSPAPFARLELPAAPQIPKRITSRWPVASPSLLLGNEPMPGTAALDRSVARSASLGGHAHARRRLSDFLAKGFTHYNRDRSEPEQAVASGLSPYLHFGHISTHEIFSEIVERERWQPEKLAVRADGRREGRWNMSANAESFLDELITWREIG